METETETNATSASPGTTLNLMRRPQVWIDQMDALTVKLLLMYPFGHGVMNRQREEGVLVWMYCVFKID